MNENLFISPSISMSIMFFAARQKEYMSPSHADFIKTFLEASHGSPSDFICVRRIVASSDTCYSVADHSFL